MLYTLLRHGSYLDDTLFIAGVIISLLLFIGMAFADRKKEDKDNEKKS